MIAKYFLAVLIIPSLLFAQGKSNLDSNEISSVSLSKSKDYSNINETENNKIGFEIGIRDELYLMFANLSSSNSTGSANTLEAGFPLMNIHLTAGIRVLDNYRIYLQYGYAYVYEDFNGFDGGIFLEANLYAGVYGLVGIDFLNKFGSSHGLSSSNEKSFTFYCAGVGYQFSKNFNIELAYYIPNDKVFGYNVNDYTYQYINKIDNGILKLGFEYIFSL